MQTETIQINNNFFNEELFKMLCDDNEDDHDNVCLITNNNLESDHITLDCKHKFNYSAIFNEIKNQKTIYNKKEVQYLQLSQIKCPYCRTVQKGLLPDRDNFPNIRGVNWPKSLQFKPNSCEYMFLSGKKKNMLCNKKCHNKYCPNHQKIMEKRLNKQQKLANYDNEKLSNETDNVTNTCIYIFKRGKNKNTKCKCQKIFENGYCKTHYKQFLKKQKTKKDKLFKTLEHINPNFKIENITIKDNKTNIKFNKHCHVTI